MAKKQTKASRLTKKQKEMYYDYLFGKALRISETGTFYTLDEAKVMLAKKRYVTKKRI